MMRQGRRGRGAGEGTPDKLLVGRDLVMLPLIQCVKGEPLIENKDISSLFWHNWPFLSTCWSSVRGGAEERGDT